jgi:hypothetical protein
MIAQELSTRTLMPLFSAVPLPEDPLRAQFPVPACVEKLVVEYESKAVQGKPDPKIQRQLSRAVDDAALEAMEDLTVEDRARISSCGAPSASLYLVGPMPQDDSLKTDFFMSHSAFTTALRLRLGLPVREAPGPCTLCSENGKSHTLDIYGHEAAKCRLSGLRTRAHNKLRDALNRLLNEALLAPAREVAISTTTSERVDIACNMSGVRHFIDVAITHPFQQSAQGVQRAAQCAGGWATEYEGVKRKKYASIFGKSNKSEGSQVLVPFVVDTFGAMGETAAAFVKRAVPLYARRLGLSTAVAGRVFAGRLTTCVIRELAEIVASA